MRLWHALAWALALRLLCAPLPHSGGPGSRRARAAAPIGGDFEAQRHWIELTTHLPPREWYAQTPRNDLAYWGLDYPPLSAFFARALGAAPFAPAALTAFRNSSLAAARAAAAAGRAYVPGDEDDDDDDDEEDDGGDGGDEKGGGGRGAERARAPGAAARPRAPRRRLVSPIKAFMRAAAVLGDAAVLAPACALLALRLARAQAAPGAPPRAVEAAAARTALLLLAQPALLLIDHGHFQHNGVFLGLSLSAVASLAGGAGGAAQAAGWRRLWRHLVPCAVLFALALNFKQSSLYYAPAFFVFLLLECLVEARRAGAAVRGGGGGGGGGDLVLQWGGYEFGAASASALNIATVGAAVAAVFSLLWAPFCVDAQAGLGANAEFSARLRACAGGLHAVWRRLFPLARNIFEDKVANVWCALEPLLRLRARLGEEAASASGPGALHGAAAVLCAAATLLLASPSLLLLARRGALELRSSPLRERGRPSGPAPLGRRKAAGAGGRRRGSSAVPTAAAAVAQPVNAAASLSAAASSDHARDAVPAPAAPFEHLLLCMFNVSSAAFLCGYQVHEKSVLLPLLPLQALHARLPLLSAWLAAAALLSLGPLLAKDALLEAPLPLAGVLALALLHAAVGGAAGGGRARAGVSEAAALRVALQRAFGAAPAADDLRRWLRRGAAATVVLGLALALAAAFVAPPPRLPDLHAYLNAVACAAMLFIGLVLGTAVQFSWLVEEEEGPEKTRESD